MAATTITSEQLVIDAARERQSTINQAEVDKLQLSTDSYVPTEVLKEQTRLRHPQCVCPLCTRPARLGDNDHIVGHPIGPTSTPNLASLCRGHHRLKTHTDWTYQWIPGTGFVWTSPLGHRHTG